MNSRLVIGPDKLCTIGVPIAQGLHGHISELSCYICQHPKQDPPFSQFWLLSMLSLLLLMSTSCTLSQA